MNISEISAMDPREVIRLFYASSRMACLEELCNTEDKARRALLYREIEPLFDEERKALELLDEPWANSFRFYSPSEEKLF